MNRYILFSAVWLLLLPAIISYSQKNSDLLRVQLKLDTTFNPFIPGYGVVFDSINTPAEKTASLGEKRFKLIGADTVEVRFKIDQNRNNSFDDDVVYRIQRDSFIVVDILKSNKETEYLPYKIAWSESLYNLEQNKVFLNIRPRYSANGYLTVGTTSHKFWIIDINTDGKFSRREGGTSVGIDFNNNKELYRGEWFYGNQIIIFHETPLVIDSIEENGAFIIFKKSVRALKVGDELPFLTANTTSGETVYFNTLKGKYHLIDFWASWCAPCIAKFPAVKKIADAKKGKLSVLTVNVDYANRMPQAMKIISGMEPSWQHIAQARGEDELLWVLLRGSSDTGVALSIPVFVLADEKGIIRYIGNGGTENIEELAGMINTLIK